MFTESDKAEARVDIPEFDFAVFAAAGEELAVRGVADAAHVVGVALLLQTVDFAWKF